MEKLSQTDMEIKELSKKFSDMQNDYKKLEKDHGNTIQELERERNLKTKTEIENNYIKSLRYTVRFLYLKKKSNLFDSNFQN
jgi:hypothetical protein